MINNYEEWSDLCELLLFPSSSSSSSSSPQEEDTTTTKNDIDIIDNDDDDDDDDIVLHLYKPTRNNCILSSTILQPLVMPSHNNKMTMTTTTMMMMDNKTFNNNNNNNSNTVVLIHPLLYEFLIESSILEVDDYDDDDDDYDDNYDDQTTKTKLVVGLPVQIQPFPNMEPPSLPLFLDDDDDDDDNQQTKLFQNDDGCFRIKPIRVINLGRRIIVSQQHHHQHHYNNNDTSKNPEGAEVTPPLVVASCVFIDCDDYLTTTNNNNDNNNNQTISTMFSEALEGRIIMKGCIILVWVNMCDDGSSDDGVTVSTSSHPAIIRIDNIIMNNNNNKTLPSSSTTTTTMPTETTTDLGDINNNMNNNNTTAYRLGSKDTFQIQITINNNDDEQIINDNSSNYDDKYNVVLKNDNNNNSIPGYQTLLDGIIKLLDTTHNKNLAAASPSGILLTGVSGVGKSRLVSCIASHYHNITNNNSTTINNNGKKSIIIIYHLSVHDLFFQATTTNDLFQDIIKPRLLLQNNNNNNNCKMLLWIIDDLSILERENQNDNDNNNSLEYICVLNAIIRGIDYLVHQKQKSNKSNECCRIVGIGRTIHNLPNELTKIGRLEKQIEMIAPTQLQRQEIWKHIFDQHYYYDYYFDHHDEKNVNQNEDDDDSSLNLKKKKKVNQWISALVATTGGCVAADLIRIYETAKTRTLARRSTTTTTTTTSSSTSDDLQWEDLRDAARSTIPTELAELDVIKPRSTFDRSMMSWPEMHQRSWASFGGYSTIKRQVYRNVVAPWHNFMRRMNTTTAGLLDGQQQDGGGNFWLAPPTGVIFHGPSGCGKSFGARCLANSLQLPMVQVRATDVLNKYLGGSEAVLRSIFTRARASSPCIIFLDEIDAISNNRSEDDSNELGARILSTLLNEMDGVATSKNNQVLVVACSNRLGAIDSALLRSGRLEEHLYLGPPTPDDLEEILKLHSSRMPLDKRLRMATIAKRLFEYNATPAEVEGLCREVCFIALRRVDNNAEGDVIVLPEDFDNALEALNRTK